MSGLAAVVDFGGHPVSPRLLEAMATQVAARGRDGISYRFNGQVGLASLALHSTHESEQEDQPLVSDDGRFMLVADARIDNRQELLVRLIEHLPRGRVIGDAELVLAACRRWSTEAPLHLLGDFAFVLWDKLERRLFAACDPLGVCPLHYARFGTMLCLATEAQQVLQHPGCSRRLDQRVLADWLIGELNSAQTIFRGIVSLPAAHRLVASDDRVRVSRYWDIDPANRIRYRKVSEYADHLRELLGRCVADRLRSNADTVGSEMSGGMDSTTVTSLAQGLCPQLKVLSLRYPTLDDCDESPYIREMTNHLDLDTEMIEAEQHGARNYPDRFAPSLENPGTKFDPVHAALVDALVPTGARVLLSGNGGDEMTWGNGIVYGHRLWHGDPRALLELYGLSRELGGSFWRLFRTTCVSPYVPPAVKRAYRHLRGRGDPHLPPWFSRPAAARLGLLEPHDPPCPDFGNAPQRQMYFSLVYGSMRSVIDSCTLIAAPKGITVRHPFLDRRLAEFAFAVPVSLWTRGSYAKWLMRRATAGLLPDVVRWRKDKTMFSSFYTHGIRADPDKFRRRLMDLQKTELVDVDVLARWFTEQFSVNPHRAVMQILMPLQVRDWIHHHRDSLDVSW